jgi:beta-glucanase (GH16 family)
MSPFSNSEFDCLTTHQWPYSYDSCDVGTLPNQTINGGPPAALTNGDPYNGDVISYLPGQRLSRCTCKGESHPGPVHSDGTYVGRSAPEIDIFESQVKSDVFDSDTSFSRVVDHRYAFARSSLPVCAVGCE